MSARRVRPSLTSVIRFRDPSEAGEVSYGTSVSGSVNSAPDSLGAPTASLTPAPRTLDLTDEARRILTEHRRNVLLGFAIGIVFGAVGVGELVYLGVAAFNADSLIAIILLVLGGSIAWLSYRGGLRDPVVRIHFDEARATFTRHSGQGFAISWSDPRWDLEIDDPAPDPAAPAEAKGHLFFTGVGPVYGTLRRTQIGPILDAARGHGLRVTIREVTVGGRRRLRVRRIRIRAYPPIPSPAPTREA